ncbi:hypothetical protein SAMN06309944_0338 [Micrococcales bacterium KH10]|nr:hypothetical protein SAMN06309944_0338 [Micrococcales bacterium KH10]
MNRRFIETSSGLAMVFVMLSVMSGCSDDGVPTVDPPEPPPAVGEVYVAERPLEGSTELPISGTVDVLNGCLYLRVPLTPSTYEHVMPVFYEGHAHWDEDALVYLRWNVDQQSYEEERYSVGAKISLGGGRVTEGGVRQSVIEPVPESCKVDSGWLAT